MSKSKYLDLAGLTAYDRKLKEWFKAGVVDIADEAIRALFVTVVEGPADNEIWYTTSDGYRISPMMSDEINAAIVSNTYENGKGIFTFDGPITNIGYAAFSARRTLTSITIPNSVTSIEIEAFSNCSSLASINIGNSITEIGPQAFYNCSFTSIAIPNSVTRIKEEAFRDCSALTSITYEGTIEQWNAITKEKNWNYKVPATYVQCSDGQVPL